MLPNTGLEAGDVELKALLVCGEDAGDLETALSATGAEYEPVQKYREFRTYRAKAAGAGFTVCLTGLGSASVEVGLTELYMCGARQFVHTGTCGSLGGLIANNSVVLVDEAESHDGASFHYSPGESLRPAGASCLHKAKHILEINGVEYITGRMISTDTFYCMGAARDASGGIARPGLPLKPGFDPPRKFLELKRMLDDKKPYLIDMEAAAFYAICPAVDDDIFFISIKGVANSVPFVPGEQVENTGASLRKAIEAALCVLVNV